MRGPMSYELAQLIEGWANSKGITTLQLYVLLEDIHGVVGSLLEGENLTIFGEDSTVH